MAKSNKRKRSKGRKSSSGSNRPPSVWLVGSPLYKELADLCEKKGWQQRKYLPRKGSNQAQELDKIIEKGLGNGKPLSRNQLSRKLKQWKGSFESEKSIRKLDEAKFENGVELYGRLKRTDCWMQLVESLCIDMYSDESPTYSEAIHGWLLVFLCNLRKGLVDSINKLLADPEKGGENDYTVMEEDALDSLPIVRNKLAPHYLEA
jgi:hypothetical protein